MLLNRGVSSCVIRSKCPLASSPGAKYTAFDIWRIPSHPRREVVQRENEHTVSHSQWDWRVKMWLFLFFAQVHKCMLLIYTDTLSPEGSDPRVKRVISGDLVSQCVKWPCLWQNLHCKLHCLPAQFWKSNKNCQCTPFDLWREKRAVSLDKASVSMIHVSDLINVHHTS